MKLLQLKNQLLKHQKKPQLKNNSLTRYMQKEDCYYVGKITKPHGFKGNLIVHLETDEPELYENMESVFIETNGMLVPFFFEFAQVHGNNKLLVKFEDVSAEEAERLVNKELYLPLDTLPELEGNDF